MNLMESFMEGWGVQYRKAKSILAYLGTYTESLSHLELDGLVDFEEMDQFQEDWVRLCTKFDNPLEMDFFKPYWIPVKKDSYDFFMDISDEAFPIFDAKFFFLKPYRWYKHMIVDDISGLMLASENDADVKAIFERQDQERWNEVSAIFDENMQLAFQGKLEVEPVTRNEIIPDPHPDPDEDVEMDMNPVGEFMYSTRGLVHTVSGIQALVVGLLPYTQTIRLHEIQYKHGEPFNKIEDVKTIRDLVYLIRHTGQLRVAAYKAELVDFPGNYFNYDGEGFEFRFGDSGLASDFIKELEKLKI